MHTEARAVLRVLAGSSPELPAGIYFEGYDAWYLRDPMPSPCNPEQFDAWRDRRYEENIPSSVWVRHFERRSGAAGISKRAMDLSSRRKPWKFQPRLPTPADL